MPNLVEINGKKYWSDYKGDLVAVENITKEDKERDKMVTMLVEKSEKMHAELTKFKDFTVETLSGYLEGLAEKKIGKKWKGNAQIINFGQNMRVMIKTSENISFNEKLQLAKQLIEDCLREWSEGSNPAISMIVEKAFETDKKGNINKYFVLKLPKMKVTAKTRMAEWNKAMALISESIEVESTKTYHGFQKRNEKGEWETVILDFASI